MAIFTNQATLSYNGTTVSSNTVSGNLVEALSITKTAVVDRYSADDTVTYVISLTNTGVAPITGLTLTDNLGAYTFGAGTVTPLTYIDGSVIYYQNGVLQASPTVVAADPLTVTGITVPAGGNAILVYEAATNGYAPLDQGSSITNTASVTGTGITAEVSADETVTVVDSALLGITKSLDPVNVTENSPLTYTFTVTNVGNTEAGNTDNVVISDRFDPILSDITVTLNGDLLPESAYTYDEATGLFSTVAGEITVPAATYTQDPVTGVWSTAPGVTVLTVTGTV